MDTVSKMQHAQRHPPRAAQCKYIKEDWSRGGGQSPPLKVMVLCHFPSEASLQVQNRLPTERLSACNSQESILAISLQCLPVSSLERLRAGEVGVDEEGEEHSSAPRAATLRASALPAGLRLLYFPQEERPTRLLEERF